MVVIWKVEIPKMKISYFQGYRDETPRLSWIVPEFLFMKLSPENQEKLKLKVIPRYFVNPWNWINACALFIFIPVVIYMRCMVVFQHYDILMRLSSDSTNTATPSLNEVFQLFVNTSNSLNWVICLAVILILKFISILRVFESVALLWNLTMAMAYRVRSYAILLILCALISAYLDHLMINSLVSKRNVWESLMYIFVPKGVSSDENDFITTKHDGDLVILVSHMHNTARTGLLVLILVNLFLSMHDTNLLAQSNREAAALLCKQRLQAWLSAILAADNEPGRVTRVNQLVIGEDMSHDSTVINLIQDHLFKAHQEILTLRKAKKKILIDDAVSSSSKSSNKRSSAYGNSHRTVKPIEESSARSIGVRVVEVKSRRKSKAGDFDDALNENSTNSDHSGGES